VIPRGLVGLTSDDIVPIVDESFDALIRMLTLDVETAVAHEESVDPAGEIAVEGADRYLAEHVNLNRIFLEHGWHDGVPEWAPTRERVDAMLTGTRRQPADLIATLAPGMGLATVEKIAINAVMAGCDPAHLPVLIAAVEAISDPRFYLRNVALSTGPH